MRKVLMLSALMVAVASVTAAERAGPVPSARDGVTVKQRIAQLDTAPTDSVMLSVGELESLVGLALTTSCDSIDPLDGVSPLHAMLHELNRYTRGPGERTRTARTTLYQPRWDPRAKRSDRSS